VLLLVFLKIRPDGKIVAYTVPVQNTELQKIVRQFWGFLSMASAMAFLDFSSALSQKKPILPAKASERTLALALSTD
jgi:hypothetical protein